MNTPNTNTNTSHPPTRLTALTPSKTASGAWDSIHVFEASERGRSAHYKLTSTVMLQLVSKGLTPSASAGAAKVGGGGEGKQATTENVDLSGSMTRQVRFPFSFPVLSFPSFSELTFAYHYPTHADRARLPPHRLRIPHRQHRTINRRSGDQDAEPPPGGVFREDEGCGL